MGTFCRFSVRFSAVTTISLNWLLSSARARVDVTHHAASAPVDKSNVRETDGIDDYSRKVIFLVTPSYTGKATLSTTVESFVQFQRFPDAAAGEQMRPGLAEKAFQEAGAARKILRRIL